jgi:hypothetical protein
LTPTILRQKILSATTLLNAPVKMVSEESQSLWTMGRMFGTNSGGTIVYKPAVTQSGSSCASALNLLTLPKDVPWKD